MSKQAWQTIRQVVYNVLADKDSSYSPKLEFVMAKSRWKHIWNWWGQLWTFGDVPFWMKHPLIFSQALKLSALAGQAARVVQASVLKGLTTWTISTEEWHRLAPVNNSMDHTDPHHWSRKWHCDCSQAGGSWYSSWCWPSAGSLHSLHQSKASRRHPQWSSCRPCGSSTWKNPRRWLKTLQTTWLKSPKYRWRSVHTYLCLRPSSPSHPFSSAPFFCRPLSIQDTILPHKIQ